MNESDLWRYQSDCAQWICDREGGMIWLGLGDGKTAIALTAMARLGERALVVGPLEIVKNTWPAEIAKWEHTRFMTYEVCAGRKRLREKAVLADPDILGVSLDNLAWYLRNYAILDNRPLLVIDELSHLSSPRTQRFRELKRHIVRFDRTFGLTATPATESFCDLWAQWVVTGRDERLGRNITAFRAMFTTESFNGFARQYTVEEEGKQRIIEALSDGVFVIDDIDRPPVPEPLFEEVVVPWTSTGSAARYRTMERDAVAQLEDDSMIAAGSASAVWNKCRQIANGFLYHEDGVEVGDLGKLEALEREVEALGEERALIFYQYQWERDEILRRVPNSISIKAVDAIAQFDAGKMHLVLHPQNAGYGLNLQSGRHLFWFGLPWSGRQYFQANGRIVRQGQRRRAVIKRFTRENTIDTEVFDRVTGKLANDRDLLERVRARHG